MFCAVAEGAGLAAAADKLHLTRSAISHGLKLLETQVGCRLFERAGKKMMLNQAGEQLLSLVRSPLAALDAAAESLKHLGKWGETRLRLGVTASLCQRLLPTVIRDLRKAHRQLELQVRSGDTADLIERLRSNQIDVALGLLPENENGLEVRPLFHDELMFAFAPSHLWAAGRPIRREELCKQPLILYQRASLTTHLVAEFFRGLNLVPRAIMEIDSIEAIKELVKLNLGVAVLAPWTAEDDLARGKLKMRPLGKKRLTRQWRLFYRSGHRLSLVEENFYKLCRQQALGMRLDRKDVPPMG